MIRKFRTFHRLDPLTKWHYQVIPGDDFANHLATAYQNELISKEIRVDDPFTITFILVWTSQEIHLTYTEDPVCNQYWSVRDQYNAENNITIDPPVIIEI